MTRDYILVAMRQKFGVAQKMILRWNKKFDVAQKSISCQQKKVEVAQKKVFHFDKNKMMLHQKNILCTNEFFFSGTAR